MKRHILSACIILPAVTFIGLAVSLDDNFYFIPGGALLLLGLANILIAIYAPHKSIRKINFLFDWNKVDGDQNYYGVANNQNEKRKSLAQVVKITLGSCAVSLVIVYLSVFHLNRQDEPNIVLGYLKSFYEFVAFHPLIMLNFFIFLIILYDYRNLKGPNLELLTKSVRNATLSLFLGVVIALLQMYLVALGQISFTYFSLERRDVVSDIDRMLNRLSNENNLSGIIKANDDTEKYIYETLLIDDRLSDKHFYGNILSSVLKIYHPFPKSAKEKPVYLVNNTLVINKFDQGVFESISPKIGQILVSQAFDKRFIKESPNITLIGRQEYIALREQQINEQVKEIEAYLNDVQGVIDSIENDIQYARRMVGQNQSSIANAKSSKVSSYSYCRSQGYYDIDWEWQRYHSKSYCEAYVSQWDSEIAGYQSNISYWNRQIGSLKKTLEEYQELEKSVIFYRNMAEASKDNTPQELGVFYPEKEIKIALDSLNEKDLFVYFGTLAHEYLHFTSYVSGERRLPTFYEEALTEVFSRQVLRKNFNVESKLGYPVQTRVMEEISKKVSEEQLKEIYFTKDEMALRSVLNSAFGEDFYDQSNVYINLISYVSPYDALKYANNLMARIGGELIDESEMYSTLSEFK